jgi:RNA polymerase sigma-70 factor (ECF subfamily)
VVALVAAIVGDRHQAEDIAQEAFSRALTRWHRVARYELPEAWVRRVALRLTIDAARRTRQVLVLYYLADLPVGDIARDCGISVSTVRSRLAAARHRLQRELTESDEEVPNAR